MSEFIDQTTKLENGVSIVTRTMPDRRRAAFQIAVRAGASAEEPYEHGCAHFVEHLLLCGTPRRPSAMAVKKEFGDLGFGSINAGTMYPCVILPTAKEGTLFYSPSKFYEALDICLDVVSNPRFDPGDFEGERARILEEIDAQQRNQDDVRMRQWQAALFDGTPRARSLSGSSEQIRNTTLNSLKEFYRRTYTGKRFYVFAAGNIEHDRVVEKVRSYLGDRLPGTSFSLPTITLHPAEVRIPREEAIQQIAFKLLWPGATANDPSSVAMNVAARMLATMLNREAANRQKFVYDLGTSLWSHEDVGGFEVSGKCTVQKSDAVFEIIGQCLRQLHNDTPSDLFDTEIQSSKNYWEVFEPTVVGEANRLLAETFYLGRLLSVDEYMARIERVTLKDIQTIAGNILESPMALYAEGPIDRFPSRAQIEEHIRIELPEPVDNKIRTRFLYHEQSVPT